MSDPAAPRSAAGRRGPDAATVRRMAKRHAAERRFRRACLFASLLGLAFLALLFADLVRKGFLSFFATEIVLDVTFDAEVIDPSGGRDPDSLRQADYQGLARQFLAERFSPSGRDERRELFGLISSGASFTLRDEVLADPDLIGQRRKVSVLASDDLDLLAKGLVDRSLAEGSRTITDRQIAWFDELVAEGRVRRRFNSTLFTAGDSREPEQAGLRAALMGSFYMLLVTLALSLPLGVAAAIYLEEFAPKNKWWLDLLEVNINNLAAVPSIVFGLLGLAMFLGVFGLPRSAPLVGGLVLTLVTLPTIIIASRAAIQAVPPSVRQAAYGLGATQMQVAQHHVLPLALPGILTGAILGMARALGETAPLLMIGMVAFIVDVPQGPLDPATALPVQIYLWADSPERAFVGKTSAAILVLLVFLLGMNALAIFLRRRWERRW